MNVLDFREPVSAWSHCAGLFLSIPATLILWRFGRGDLGKRLSLLVFGASLVACYLGSTLFHGVRAGRDTIYLFERLDHVGIHVLIAGSYTPLAWNLLRGRWRVCTLAAVWLATLVGSTMLLVDLRVPPVVSTFEYISLGWGALFCYFEIARVLTHRPLRPLLVGGFLYTVGAVLNLLQWPVPWPGVVGSHEVFHLWVIAGSATHFWFMLSVVAPFAWAADARQAAREWATVPVQAEPWQRRCPS